MHDPPLRPTAFNLAGCCIPSHGLIHGKATNPLVHSIAYTDRAFVGRAFVDRSRVVVRGEFSVFGINQEKGVGVVWIAGAEIQQSTDPAGAYHVLSPAFRVGW